MHTRWIGGKLVQMVIEFLAEMAKEFRITVNGYSGRLQISSRGSDDNHEHKNNFSRHVDHKAA